MLNEVLERHLREIQSGKTTSVVFAAPKVGKDAPTDKQVAYFKALVEKKQLTEDKRDILKNSLAVFTKRDITGIIQWLMGLPWTPRPVVAVPVPHVQTPISKIGEGNYAVTDPSDGLLKFYQVRRPKEGKWAGFVFISQLSGENHIPIRDRNERDRIYSLIAADVTGSLKLYGQKIGRCGHCRKQLTDEVSREFGIGPVCRKELGI